MKAPIPMNNVGAEIKVSMPKGLVSYKGLSIFLIEEENRTHLWAIFLEQSIHHQTRGLRNNKPNERVKPNSQKG